MLQCGRLLGLTQPETVAHQFHHLIELTRDVEGHVVWKRMNGANVDDFHTLLLCSVLAELCVVSMSEQPHWFSSVTFYTAFLVSDEMVLGMALCLSVCPSVVSNLANFLGINFTPL
jgi:hypothetical protein